MTSLSTQTCLFCKIVSKHVKSHTVWESDTHFAFLSIFPNTKGVTVVIPKKHFDSYAFDMPSEDLNQLMDAARTVAKILDEKLGVARTALVFEGFGVNHVHAKLFPLHGTSKNAKWVPKHSEITTYFNNYEGYISSHDAQKADDKDLEDLSSFLQD